MFINRCMSMQIYHNGNDERIKEIGLENINDQWIDWKAKAAG